MPKWFAKLCRKRPAKGKCRLPTIPIRTLICWEWETYDRRAMCIGGAILLFAALFCRLAVGSPIYARCLFDEKGAMPPTPMLYLCGGALDLALGALIGAMLAAPTPAILRARFKGTALLVPTALFRLCWYPLLFGALTPALALISLALALFCAVTACLYLRGQSRIAPLVLLAECLWMLRLASATIVWFLFN